MTLSKLTQLYLFTANWLLSWASNEDPTHAERYRHRGKENGYSIEAENSCQSVLPTQLCSDACRGAQSGQMDLRHAEIFVWP